MSKERQVDPKNAKHWDKGDLVIVKVLDTGVEEVVCRGYYKAYANEGLAYLGDYVPEKEPEDMSYDEMKAYLASKGMTFKGNASKEDLLELLKEA